MDLKQVINSKFRAKIIMYSEEQLNDLTGLFRETGIAHHKAFIETDGFDTEWPIWYSDFLHEKMMDLLDVEFTRSELIYLLVAADMDHSEEAPEADWPMYYSKFFGESLL